MKIIIFDFDGTIGDTASLIVQTLQDTLAVEQFPTCTNEQCASVIGLPLVQCFTHLLPMDENAGERCAETYKLLFEENKQRIGVSMFPHVAETMQALHRQGLILTIATSRFRDSLVQFLTQMGIEKYISYIVTPNEVAHAKPAPDMVTLTLRHFGIPASEALVVGDTHYDILMGRSAGAHTCGVTYGNGTHQQLKEAGAEYIIDDFADVLTTI